MTLKTALYDSHISSKGKCIPFANYSLPVWFSSIKEEHMAVRQGAGIFDISHMGIISIEGDDCDAFMSRLSCNDISKAKQGKMIYSMFLNEHGMVLDDVMFAFHDNKWMLIVNGSNREKISKWMQGHKPDSVTITEHNDDYSFIAVQGPKATQLLTEQFGQDFTSIGRFSMTTLELLETPITVSRTGYTGEDGFECIVPNHLAESFWKRCVEGGCTPCGLGARDTLRIEKGLPLYGQELSESIHPFMTRYGWVVKFNHDFIGREALEGLKDNPEWVAVFLELSEPMIARPECSIREGGRVTSGTLLPESNKSIAMAYVKPELSSKGTELHVCIRKKEIKAFVY
ncbi:glycine cleavage system aminomethyltransferase GcvT [Candidatus Marinamargulisbacteria bacterium SCGC AG-343-D04]|nr:glycine cleavage system aminomethyltransferase GcvT [Candidatus Marinamargulisbacteria bacterium SCGC AG-343-D04]